eukprot:gene5226-5758_t
MISLLWDVSSTFYFFYGLSVCLYLLILFTSKKKTIFAGPIKPFLPSSSSSSSSSSSASSSAAPSKEQVPQRRLYMNIFFLDRKELIRNIIRSKVPKSRPFVRALAKRAAVALLEKGIVERVGSSLCQIVPDRLSPLGIQCQCSIAYTEKAFLCLELSLVNLNLSQLLTYSMGTARASAVLSFLERYSLPAINETLSRWALSFMSERLLAMLPAQTRDKLYNKMNAEVEILLCTEEEQGPFLIQTIHQIQESSSASSSSAPSSTPSGPTTTSAAGASGSSQSSVPIGTTSSSTVPLSPSSTTPTPPATH